MTRVFAAIREGSRLSHGIAGVSLVLLMLITCADVILRYFRMPIPGTYEVVGFLGALAIGFAMPYTSWMRAHCYVDSIIGRLPKPARSVFHFITRLMGIALFALLAWNLVKFGQKLCATGEVSPTLELKFYPIAYGLALASLLQIVVLFYDLAKILRGEYE